MKVLLVTEVFPPRLGGDGIHVMELALHLQRLGVGVSVLTKACGEERVFPFEVKRVGLKNNGLLGRLSFILCSLFCRTDADVIHAHAAVGGAIGRFLGLVSGVPVVVTVHTIWGSSLSSIRVRGAGGLLQLVEKSIFTSKFEYYITVTREIADKLKAWGLKNIRFIPNGVNTEKFRPPADKTGLRKSMGLGKGKVLLFVGRLVQQKNVPLLLEVFAIFRKKNPGARLLIAGSGPEEGNVKAKADALGLGKSVLFLGPVDYEQLPAYYQVSDCLVLTSKWEGLPLCILEALSTGIPVVGTAVGGLPEAIDEGKTGYLAGQEPEEVCAALCKALALEPASVARYSMKAVVPYDWRNITRKVRRIYTGV